MKAQWIRIMDVVLIGPLMTYGGLKLKDTKPLPGWLLVSFGAMTVIYNGVNYYRVQQAT